MSSAGRTAGARTNVAKPLLEQHAEGRRSALLALGAALSFALHFGAYQTLPLVAGAMPEPVPLDPVEVSVEAPAEVEAQDLPEAPVEPVEPASQDPVVEQTPPDSPPVSKGASVAKPSAEPPAAVQETPVAFDNVTLTNDAGDSAWDSEIGSGTDSAGPIGAPGLATGRKRQGRRDGQVGATGSGAAQAGPALVALSKLSRAPKDPDLSDKLKRNYPPEARSQGIEGSARVRIVVNPDGGVSRFRIVSETVKGYGFGKACVKTLRGSRWSAPLNAMGVAVATQITYTCEFRVRY